MAVYPVSEKKNLALQEKIKRLALQESDFEEHFVRSQGSGGQNVNKVSTCVVMLHRPTGFKVKCQSQRSQALNRYLAKRMLVEKIEAEILGRESQMQKARQKIRRQKMRRSRRAKEKMLEAKKINSEKKRLRGRVSDF